MPETKAEKEAAKTQSAPDSSKLQDTPAGPIGDVPNTDISKWMSPDRAKRQALRGFDDDYVDIVDYIVRSTHKIWEERQIGLIYSHYRHNAQVHTSDGLTYGRDDWIAASVKTMAAYPDCRLYADDVIWSGDEEVGFHSSHRIVWTGHNTGYSAYGPPTGRKVTRQGIAHCFVKENRIIEEWVARDELALVRQLGLDEIALAKRVAAQEAARGVKLPKTLTRGEVERMRGQLPPEVAEPSSEDPEGLVRRALHEVWNWRMVGRVGDYFAANLFCWTAPHRLIYGRGDYGAYVLELLAAFPDLAITVDHQCHVARGDEARVATRWFMHGTHEGPGPYGEPTGKRVHLFGISHHDLQGGVIVREHTAFDAFALLKQIYWPDGDNGQVSV